MDRKKDIRALTREQLRDFFVARGDKAFRGNQVYEWLWQKSAHSFEDMTNISLDTREMLQEQFVINHIKVDQMQRSADGTIKNAVRLYDDLIVESVLIPTESPHDSLCFVSGWLQPRLQVLRYFPT
jgi:23S rRNA (adenine2503-C2)-methyltransferase